MRHDGYLYAKQTLDLETARPLKRPPNKVCCALWRITFLKCVYKFYAALPAKRVQKNILDLPFKYLIAFVGATGMSAVVIFVGQKFWVFRVRGMESDL